MTTLTVRLPDELKRLAEARAAEAGCADVGEYLARLIQAEAAGAPAGLHIDSDEELQALITSRMDGPWVGSDRADFEQMRRKLEAQLDERRPQP